MGKAGELLRAQKAKTTVYTFTREQLEEHDRCLILNRKKIMAKEIEKQILAERKQIMDDVTKEWDQRKAEFNSGDAKEDFYNMLQYLLCIPAAVMIEEFGWPAQPRSNNKHKNIQKFAQLVIDKIDEIAEDEKLDIRKYSDELFERYGIKFARE